MRRIVVLDEAVGDLAEARDFYDAQEAGIGNYFVDSLLTDIEKLSLSHGIHSLSFGLHRALADRFPFGIYYRETERVIQVIAILDLRRRPSWIRSELSKRNP